ncbi:MAG: DoxX family protein [Methylophilaceae bacterium]
MSLLNTASNFYHYIVSLLDRFNTWLPQLVLRLILAWEFGEAGIAKFNGENWFANLDFPFPFNIVPPEISWGMATYFEIIGAFALAIGLATRFFSLSLIILTIVAIASVHWPESWGTLAELWKGYAISDKGFGNYKLPLLLLIMLLPLLFGGAGKLSLDHLINRRK